MEKKFYPDFVLSHEYTEFVCQSELANEEYRAQSTRHDEPVNTINWSDGFGFKERVSFADKQCNLCLRQSIQEWIKYKLWTTAFKKSKLILSRCTDHLT